MADFAAYYQQIYAKGLGGETPAIPVSIAELERQAEEKMEDWAANYVFAAAGDEGTIEANREGHHRGVPVGSVRQMPGTFLVYRGEIVNAFRHERISDRPDYVALAAMRP